MSPSSSSSGGGSGSPRGMRAGGRGRAGDPPHPKARMRATTGGWSSMCCSRAPRGLLLTRAPRVEFFLAGPRGGLRKQ
eukprot:4514989-Pyramimonas_sp.AAC.1